MRHLNLKAILSSAALCALISTSAIAEQIWNRGANGDVQSLDPHKTSTIEEANILGDLFTGLVAVDAEGNATPALQKRLAALGADAAAASQLRRAADGKNEVLFYDSVAPGTLLIEGLPRALEISDTAIQAPRISLNIVR